MDEKRYIFKTVSTFESEQSKQWGENTNKTWLLLSNKTGIYTQDLPANGKAAVAREITVFPPKQRTVPN